MIAEYDQMINENEEAVCISNFHGRFQLANAKFCKLFGYQVEELEWHFMIDLHRNKEDWVGLRNFVEEFGEVQRFYSRLKNRKGRSFHCLINRKKVEDSNGEIHYVSTVQKISAPKLKDQGLMDLQKSFAEKMNSQKGGLVYLTVCSQCEKVKDAYGSWVEHGKSKRSLPISATKHVCPDCAEQLYPEIRSSVPLPKLMAR